MNVIRECPGGRPSVILIYYAVRIKIEQNTTKQKCGLNINRILNLFFYILLDLFETSVRLFIPSSFRFTSFTFLF